MGNYTDLSSLFSAIANAIRGKSGNTGQIVAKNFPDEISSLPGETQFVFGTQSVGSSSTTDFTISDLPFRPKGAVFAAADTGTGNVVKIVRYNSDFFEIRQGSGSLVSAEQYNYQVEITNDSIKFSIVRRTTTVSPVYFYKYYTYYYVVWG